MSGKPGRTRPSETMRVGKLNTPSKVFGPDEAEKGFQYRCSGLYPYKRTPRHLVVFSWAR